MQGGRDFSIGKQLTNLGHLITVIQLQEVLKMRDSQGSKSKRHFCSDQSQAMQAGKKQSNNRSH